MILAQSCRHEKAAKTTGRYSERIRSKGDSPSIPARAGGSIRSHPPFRESSGLASAAFTRRETGRAKLHWCGRQAVRACVRADTNRSSAISLESLLNKTPWAGLLTRGSPRSPPLPRRYWLRVGYREGAHRSQWRGRAGFSPVFPFQSGSDPDHPGQINRRGES